RRPERRGARGLRPGQRGRLRRLAAALPPAPVRCPVINTSGLPAGVSADPPAEDGVVLERVADFEPVSRLVGARELSETRATYGVSGAGAIDDAPSTFAAAELLIRGHARGGIRRPALQGAPTPPV